MSSLRKNQIKKAMNQITNYVVMVKLPRLSEDMIQSYNRPNKRNAKKRYHTLSFDSSGDDDDEKYFKMACTESISYPTRKKRTRRKVATVAISTRDIVPSVDEKKEAIPSTSESGDKCDNVVPEVERIVEENVNLTVGSVGTQLDFECAPSISVLPNSLVGRIRIKSPTELGCTVVFVEDSVEQSPRTTLPVASTFFKNMFPDGDCSKKATEFSAEDRSKIQLISKLYKKFFTKENQKKIKKMAQILQRLDNNISCKNDRVNEINESKGTDAEKLLLRHKAYNEFNRVKESNHAALIRQFEIVRKIFNNENFEILFQLFFLGVLKMFIVNVSSKKGTLFKKVVSLLSQSLSASDCRDERVFRILKSKTFRDDCIGLVQFIEKFSETKFFGLLFLSDSEKNEMQRKNSGGGGCGELMEAADSGKSNLGSVSIVPNTGNLNIVPCGSNLLLSPHDTGLLQHEYRKSESNASATDAVQQSKARPVSTTRPNDSVCNSSARCPKPKNCAVVSGATNVNISQKSSLSNNTSLNIALPFGNSSQPNTVTVNSHEQLPSSSVFSNDSVLSLNNTRISDFLARPANNVFSSRPSDSPQNVDVPPVNPAQFPPLTVPPVSNAVTISSRNGFQLSQNSIPGVAEADCNNFLPVGNMNDREPKTFGPTYGINSNGLLPVPMNIPEICVNSNISSSYSLNSNSHQYSTASIILSRMSTAAQPSESVPTAIVNNALPPYRITSGNENIKPSSVPVAKFKSFHDASSAAMNPNSHSNLRSLLAGNITPAEFAMLNENNFDNRVNADRSQSNPATTSSSSVDTFNSVIAENYTVRSNYPTINNYDSMWNFCDNNMRYSNGNEYY